MSVHDTPGNGRVAAIPGDSGTAGPDHPNEHGQPDDVGKPESPTKLTKPSWKYIARKTLQEFTDDQCTDLAAALTYYSVLALFPALLALVSSLGLFGQAGRRSNGGVCFSEDIGAGTVADTDQGPARGNSPRIPPPAGR